MYSVMVIPFPLLWLLWSTIIYSTDTITVREKIHELFEQEKTVFMSSQKTRRGRIVNKPRFLSKMNKTFFFFFS
jgi:hypothetical protein